MNGRLVLITAWEVAELVWGLSLTEQEALIASAKSSDPLFAGFIDDRLLCLVGFVPPTVLSDVAYLWLYATPAVGQHKVMFGRWAKRLIKAALVRYPRIVGHCTKDSANWLRTLGAIIGQGSELIPFQIGEN